MLMRFCGLSSKIWLHQSGMGLFLAGFFQPLIPMHRVCHEDAKRYSLYPIPATAEHLLAQTVALGEANRPKASWERSENGNQRGRETCPPMTEFLICLIFSSQGAFPNTISLDS